MLIIDPTDSDWWGLCHKHLPGVPLSLWHRVTTPNSRSHPTKSNSPYKTVLEPSTSDLHIYPYVNVATNNQFHCQPTRQILTILNLLKSVISTLLCRVISTCRGLWSLVIRSLSSQTSPSLESSCCWHFVIILFDGAKVSYCLVTGW